MRKYRRGSIGHLSHYYDDMMIKRYLDRMYQNLPLSCLLGFQGTYMLVSHGSVDISFDIDLAFSDESSSHYLDLLSGIEGVSSALAQYRQDLQLRLAFDQCFYRELTDDEKNNFRIFFQACRIDNRYYSTDDDLKGFLIALTFYELWRNSDSSFQEFFSQRSKEKFWQLGDFRLLEEVEKEADPQKLWDFGCVARGGDLRVDPELVAAYMKFMSLKTENLDIRFYFKGHTHRKQKFNIDERELHCLGLHPYDFYLEKDPEECCLKEYGI